MVVIAFVVERGLPRFLSVRGPARRDEVSAAGQAPLYESTSPCIASNVAHKLL